MLQPKQNSTRWLPTFSSDRERRLLISAVVIVITIYSTLGLARTLVDVLHNRELLDGIFFIGFILIGVTIVFFGWHLKPNGIEIGVWLGTLAVYLIVFARLGIPEERTHLIEYSVVASLIYEALKERSNNGRYVPSPALLAILLSSSFGIIDECIQAFIPNRVFDPRDILFNVLASVMAVVAGLILGWAKKRRK